MYVLRKVRRLGLGRALLVALEQEAARRGYRVMRLETGRRQLPAIALYKAYGFFAIPAFGEYVHDPVSCCFEKPVLAASDC